MSLEEDIARIFRDNVDRASDRLPEIPGTSTLPMRLPRLRGVPGVYVEDENTALFILETEGGEKVHLPVDGRSLGQMADLIRYVLNMSPEHGIKGQPSTGTELIRAAGGKR